jgi:uncharacterized protein YeaO (DUF488 family)
LQSPACFLHELEPDLSGSGATHAASSSASTAPGGGTTSRAATTRRGGTTASPARRGRPASARAGQPTRGVAIKRIYDPPAPTDGYRMLVDRLWPRGVRKQNAKIDEWAKDIAPSPELRKWFGHDPERFEEFARRYRAELRGHARQLGAIRERAAKQRVTLLYGARDPLINHAAVLAEALAR